MSLFQETKLPIDNIFDLFPPSEGMIIQIYGRIGSGKTYCSVRMIFDLLRTGKVVYVNFPIEYKGYDERQSKVRLFISMVIFSSRFLEFPKDNLKFFEISDEWAKTQGYETFTKWVHSRTDCWIFADEGHVWVDSYTATRMPIELRNISLHTRHYNRNIVVISQRPTAIHVTMRANVNTFFKCEKIFQMGNFVRFKVSEYQDLTNETVDEDDEKIVSRRYYWGRSKYFNAYNTRYLRKGQEVSQYPSFNAYHLGFFARLFRLIGLKKKRVVKTVDKLPLKKKVMV